MGGPIEVCVAAMPRSGHHSIMDWIRHHSGRRWAVMHFMRPGCAEYGYPHDTIRPVEPVVREAHKHKRSVIYNYEGTRLDKVTVLGAWEPAYRVIVVRDPFNWVASRVKHHDRLGTALPVNTSVLSRWKLLAREYLGETDYLGGAVRISYNNWVADGAYRASVLEALGFNPSTEPWQRVSSMGQGSSFDGQRLNGKAQQMRVFDRWQEYVDHPAMRLAREDAELVSLSDEIFGPILDS